MDNDTIALTEDAPVARQIIIPYRPRKWFYSLHRSTKRNVFLVAHRRAGKSVAICNHLIRAGIENTREYPPPRYAYIGPTFKQTKDLIWGYMKHYTAPIDGVKFSESDMQCTLPNGSMINLYGGDSAYETMRGLYFDGAAADEYALLNPEMRNRVLIPCLADYRGFLIAAGTSNGDDHFAALKKLAEENPDLWDVIDLPVTKTEALHPEEIEEMRRSMTPDAFAREMMCSFAAPVEGSYYGDLMNKAEVDGHITGVPWDPSQPVFTWWDLGIDDEMFIHFVQRAGRELHVIRATKYKGLGISQIAPILSTYGYTYGGHGMPHDTMAREISTGRSRYEVATSTLPGGHVFVAPMMPVADGIEAARTIIPMTFWDKTNAADSVLAMRNYQRGKNGNPLHNWASHGADSFRTGAVLLNQMIGWINSNNVTSINGRLRRRIRGLTR